MRKKGTKIYFFSSWLLATLPIICWTNDSDSLEQKYVCTIDIAEKDICNNNLFVIYVFDIITLASVTCVCHGMSC